MIGKRVVRHAKCLRYLAGRQAIRFRRHEQAKNFKPGRLGKAAERTDHCCFVHMSGYADPMLQSRDKGGPKAENVICRS